LSLSSSSLGLSSLDILIFLHLLVFSSTFFSMVLIWENFYAILLDGVVKHLEEFGYDGVDSFALGQG
jgi:hypothetical protein